MLLIRGGSHNPAYNLATEEFLFSVKCEEAVFLWQNGPSVIVGVNQNTLSEVDTAYLDANNIPVIRRMTGGGAVYHDLGNINFTFIEKEGEDCSFERFTRPVSDYLLTLGVVSEFSGRNDIQVDGRKISGNARIVRNGFILHHGTLLWKTDTETMGACLRPNAKKLESKGVKSVRSRVANISDFVTKKMSAPDFLDGLENYFKQTRKLSEYAFTDDEKSEILKFEREKYGTWYWNFGRSPRCDTEFERKLASGTVNIRLTLDKMVITHAEITGDFFGNLPASELAARLEGIPYQKSAVAELLKSIDVSLYIDGATAEELIGCMNF